VFDELMRRPPRRLAPALLLVGAGHALPREPVRHLRREGLDAERLVLIELGPCGAGRPVWSARHPQLRAAAERAGDAAPGGRRARARVPSVRIETHGRDEGVQDAALDAALDLALGIVAALDAELSAPAPATRPRA
jgi:hypothetical protein